MDFHAPEETNKTRTLEWVELTLGCSMWSHFTLIFLVYRIKSVLYMSGCGVLYIYIYIVKYSAEE